MRPDWTWAVIVGMVQCLFVCSAMAQEPFKPKRAILLIIDGLHWQAPEKLGLKSIQALARQGASFEQAWLVPPAHPKSGAWAKTYSSSIPNVVMLTGTVFLPNGHRMIQEVFLPNTAHVNNCPEAYASLNRGFRYVRAEKAEDSWAIGQAIELLKNEPIAFMRVHLQDTGLAGYDLFVAQQDQVHKKTIWTEGSTYIEKAKEADRQLARFVRALKDMDKWDDTLLVVTADHGQADTGWHPPEVVQTAITPLIFVGPGIIQGKVVPYAEHTDIAPTICRMLGKEPPNRNQGCGRVLSEILAGEKSSAEPRRERLKRLTSLLCEHLALAAEADKRNDPVVTKALARSKEMIYDISRFLAWPEAGTLDSLIEHNRAVVADLRKALDERPK